MMGTHPELPTIPLSIMPSIDTHARPHVACRRRAALAAHAHGIVVPLFVLLATLIMIPTGARATTYYVSPSGDDHNSGKTSDRPKCTIQAGIDAALAGDQVVLSPATYTGTGNRDLDYHGKAITVRGTDPNNPDIVATTVIDCQGSAGDYHRGFRFVSGETAGAILAGLTITNGYAPAESLPDHVLVWGGGAVFCTSTPTIHHCVFTENSADHYGGAICIWSGNPVITDCTFSGNVSTNGGALALELGGCVLRACVFTSNAASWYGGALYNYSTSPTVTDCVFNSNNAAYSGGAIKNYSSSSPALLRCTFASNTSAAGGAIDNNANSNPTLTDCSFSANAATVDGGGLHNMASTPTLVTCTFDGNTAGGRGGGLSNLDNSNALLRNCTLRRNSCGDSGGGIYNYHSAPTVTDCHVSENGAPAGSGGGLANRFSSPAITRCTFDSNTANQGAGVDNTDSCDASFQTCTFTNNIAASSGGGMATWAGNDGTVLFVCHPTLTDCTFESNRAGRYGGGMDALDSDSHCIRCTFTSNHAGNGGGAAFINGTSAFDNCTFVENEATDETNGYGGGIANYVDGLSGDPGLAGGYLTLTGCTFSGNTALLQGGGVDLRLSGRAPLAGLTAGATVRGCWFINNTAGSGAGLSSFGCESELINCAFRLNVAGVGNGGGMYYSGHVTLTNCTFNQNAAAVGLSMSGGAVYGSGSAAARNCAFWDDVPNEVVAANMTIDFSDVKGGWSSGDHNINAHPLFVDGAHPIMISCDSPCRGAGNPAFVPPDVTTDIDGNPRSTSCGVSIGAYENPTCTTACGTAPGGGGGAGGSGGGGSGSGGGGCGTFGATTLALTMSSLVAMKRKWMGND